MDGYTHPPTHKHSSEIATHSLQERSTKNTTSTNANLNGPCRLTWAKTFQYNYIFCISKGHPTTGFC